MRAAVRLLVLVTYGIALVWARRAGDPIKPGFNLFSKIQDIQIGQSAAYQVQKQYQTVADPFLADYIKRCGERLASTPEAKQSGFHFTFTMLNVSQVNAFALPGGPMFIFTGLFKATENEAQLAGVMAHEMSHVILRHGTHEASKARLVNLSAILAGAAAGSGSAMGELARAGLGLGANSLILKFSREAESEADLLGAHMMAAAGYNPLEMARFFEKLGENGGQGMQFFSDHPSPENRERAIEAEIRGLPQREYGFEAGGYARAKEAAISTVSNAGGVRAAAPVPPAVELAAPWASYRGPKFTVAYPASWKIDFTEDALTLRIAVPGATTRNARGSVQVLSGVTFAHFVPGVGRGNLATGSLELVGLLHDERPALKLTDAPPRKLVVDGAEALLTGLTNQAPSGGPEADALLTVMRPDGVFYALFVAPQSEFPRLQSVFQRILDSIHFVG